MHCAKKGFIFLGEMDNLQGFWKGILYEQDLFEAVS